ncbi:hypothetical protein LCGC14_1456530, partial [marine sediment metagenome]
YIDKHSIFIPSVFFSSSLINFILKSLTNKFKKKNLIIKNQIVYGGV